MTMVPWPSAVGRSVKVRSAWNPTASAVMAKVRGRSLLVTTLRSSTGCDFHLKTSGCAAPPCASIRTQRQARYHDGQRSTSVSRSHTRSGGAGIAISLRTSIGGPDLLNNLLFRHDLPGALHQHDQDGQRAAADADRRVALQEQLLAWYESEGPE